MPQIHKRRLSDQVQWPSLWSPCLLLHACCSPPLLLCSLACLFTKSQPLFGELGRKLQQGMSWPSTKVLLKSNEILSSSKKAELVLFGEQLRSNTSLLPPQWVIKMWKGAVRMNLGLVFWKNGNQLCCCSLGGTNSNWAGRLRNRNPPVQLLTPT